MMMHLQRFGRQARISKPVCQDPETILEFLACVLRLCTASGCIIDGAVTLREVQT
jgi:hypothetical protein